MLYKSEGKKIRALQKPLSEGCINGNHLLKKIRLITFMEVLVVDMGVQRNWKGGKTEGGGENIDLVFKWNP